MLEALAVRTTLELQQIIDLQKIYLRGKTSEQEEKEQGFLTEEHTLNTLTQMHQLEPSIIF